LDADNLVAEKSPTVDVGCSPLNIWISLP